MSCHLNFEFICNFSSKLFSIYNFQDEVLEFNLLLRRGSNFVTPWIRYKKNNSNLEGAQNQRKALQIERDMFPDYHQAQAVS
jgi:hypothetical protein